MLKFYLISIMVCFIIIKIPKANMHIKYPDIKVKQTHFYEKKNVLDNVMCPDSDRYFILFLYTDGNPCSTGVPHKVNDDTVTCSQRRCPYGYACVGRKDMFAVCCPIGHGK